MARPIAISLSPNTEAKDYSLALRLLLSPWEYSQGKYVRRLEGWFKRCFGVRFAVSFDSGRSAEYAMLTSLGIGKGDHVLIQAFTCVAVPNAVLWTGATPIYVDVLKNSFNMDPLDLKRKITKDAKAVIVQHTFGISANIDAIQKIARAHKLILIEDCAHSLGGAVRGKRVGTFGDVSFFSFGRDKVVSSVFGGMVITNSEKIGTAIAKFQKDLPFPSVFWTMQQLFHPVLFFTILPTYHFFHLGKVILRLGQKLHLLSLAVAQAEKRGEKPSSYPRRLPNALAALALLQLKRLEGFNRKRRAIARIYSRELERLAIFLPQYGVGDVLLRFPILVQKPRKLLNFAKKRAVYLGNWYAHGVDPKDVDLKRVGYRKGSVRVAQELASQAVNLPTYPTMRRSDVDKVVTLLKDFYGKH